MTKPGMSFDASSVPGRKLDIERFWAMDEKLLEDWSKIEKEVVEM